ncbi:uncharacterized protein LOC125279969 [Megalobrama amblycephala]|uniref:uncharacterized protein LOC125279969 n=1 Tax=Megalobrama amblycephala TaxID=75352 RepID=UPI00201431E7|nr:uncharacterized protein LOC125279969 [Megalobrama amblycephala]
MDLLLIIFVAVIPVVANGFTVKSHSGPLLVSGSSRSIFASVGEDVTLSCSVDSHITPEHIEEVSWKKTDDILVLLYQNNETFPDSSDERYRDRVEFFTDEIPKGNFSLRLKSVRTEDKGVYMCQVFAGGLSANATVVLEQLGFSFSHIMVLILCIFGSGSAVLLCCLIYCKSPNKGMIQPFVPLGSSVILPCFAKKHLLKENLKVEWRRTDTKALVHLYQDGESRPEKQHKDYHDRVHFFTDEIQHGNFSLQLDSLSTVDDGEYTCKVYEKQDCVYSTKIILELECDRSSSIPGFTVHCPFGHLVISLGSSVVLPCYCNKHLPLENLKVEWRRTDSETLVHQYQDGESRAEAQQQEDYHDRAHFFTDQIQQGNFSLRLDDLRAEDKGEYTCKVYSKQTFVFSTETYLEVGLLDSFFHLQMLLVVCPNMIMCFAFVLWGVSEGSVNESVSCCALYFLRPLLLLWAAPYITNFTGNIKTLILKYSYVAEYVVLSAVVYLALFTSALEKLLNYAEFERVAIIVLFATVFLCCLSKIIYLVLTQIRKKSGRIINIFDVVADMIFEILPTLQFILLFFTFGSVKGALIIVVILPVLLMLTNDTWFFRCYDRLDCSDSVIRTVMLIFILVINVVMIILYIMTLENKTDAIGWGCVMVFLQILWAVMKFTLYFLDFDDVFPRVVPVYVFGSVGVVLLTSVTLMTELILKTVNGDRTFGDLRFVVFPSECFFAVSLLISGLFPSGIAKCLKSCQQNIENTKQTPDDGSQQNQKTEMSLLKTEVQD